MNETKYHLSTPMGIHRLIREPFDDREIFNSTSDLLNYCNNGARYNGQKVSCIIGSGEYSYIQNFTINNDYPIIDFPNGEHIIQKNNNRYVLVYYYNPVNDATAMYDASKSHLNYFNDPFRFSILELLDVFSPYPQKSFTFNVVRTNPETKVSRTTTFTQSWNPVTESAGKTRTKYEILYTPNSEHGMLTGKCMNADNSSTIEYFYLIPKGNTEKMITAVYIEASAYLKAMGVH